MLSGLHGAQGVIVTAKTSRIGYHFISRYFAPKVGIDEDHATGALIASCRGIGAINWEKRKKWWAFKLRPEGLKFVVRFLVISGPQWVRKPFFAEK